MGMYVRVTGNMTRTRSGVSRIFYLVGPECGGLGAPPQKNFSGGRGHYINFSLQK